MLLPIAPIVAPLVQAAEKQAEEEKELAKLMMSNKKRKLYERMQYGINKKSAAADVLRQKRVAIDAASSKAPKKRKNRD